MDFHLASKQNNFKSCLDGEEAINQIPTQGIYL